MIRHIALSLAIAIPLTVATSGHGETPAVGETLSFYRDIRPIFQARCHGCHQPAKAAGQYVMTSPERLRQGGESEQPAIAPGDPNSSYLLEQITPDNGGAAMPQDGEPLDADQIELVRRWIASGAIDDTPPAAGRRYDTEHPPQYARPPVITSLDYSPDGTLLAVAGFHEVLLHQRNNSQSDVSVGDNPQPIARLIGMSERIESVRFSPDGSKLAVTGGLPARMGEVQIWDVASHQLELSVPVTFDTVYGASWSPDGKLLAFGCTDSTVRAIDTETGKQVLYQSAHSDWALDTVFSTDGSHLASVGRDASAKLIEVATQRFVDNITSITPGALRGGINAVARHPQRDEILFGGADGTPKIYRMHRTTKRVIGDDANLLWELPPLPGRVFDVDYSQDGRLIAAASSLDGNGAIHIYGIAAEPETPKEINAILVKPTHTRSLEERQKLEQHFVQGIEAIAQLSIEGSGIYAVSIRHDGRHVAAAGADGLVRVIETETGTLFDEFFPIHLVEHQAASQIVERNPPGDDSGPATQATTPRSGQADRSSRLDEALPENVQVVRLSIQPDMIQLRDATAYAQVIVSAELVGGDVIDVTRLVDWKLDAPIAEVSPSGLVTASSDGTTSLTATLAGKTAPARIESSGVTAPLRPDFVQDVAPILARAGCNAGTCHGAQAGKNGFKLSLRGYDPLFDLRALADDLGSRRINLAAAAQSLMLLKPTASVPHEGGQALTPESDYYSILRAWIASGAALDLESAQVAKIVIHPTNPIVESLGSRQQMRVVATYSDGTERDVTREAFVASGNTEVAKPEPDFPGLIEVIRRGEAPILVRYEGAYAATTITVMGDRSGFTWEQPPINNRIDELVHAKLLRTKSISSSICDDYTFLRRLYLDLTGLPPSLKQIHHFIDDPHDSRWKRDQLIDQLVGSPEFIIHWTNKWADLLQVNSKFLGREGAESFRNWIREHVQANTAYDEFAHQVLTAVGSTRETPAASYYKILREPAATMENTTHLFLATRFNCNKCHDHPFERWTQDQYYQLAAFFARVGFKKDPASGKKQIAGTAVEGAKPLYEIVFTKPEGEFEHQRTGKVTAPAFPFECRYECDSDATRRERLAAWITSSDNPYFGMSYANRLWAYLTGRGLIEPIDDIRAGNPPTNPELLQWLTQQFIESGFDTQQLIRTICRSRTYQLALATNQFNEDDVLNYSHATARRLPAEVLYDAIYRTTGAPSSFPGLPQGIRAAALPDVGIRLPDGFLNNLGRPARESACECERTNELQMGPVMALINGATVGNAISHPEGAIAKLVADEPDDRRLLQQLFLRILNRPAQPEELDDTLEVIDGIDIEHERTIAELATYETELAPITAQKKQRRQQQLEAKVAELEEYKQRIASDRERMEQARADRIAAAKETLDSARRSLIEELPEWEQARRSDTVWQILSPVELSSTHGAELSELDDHSVLVQGPNGQKSTNHFIASTELADITGIRIDALTDERFPRRGPGRAEDGNFVLTELRLETSPQSNSPPAYEVVKLQNAKSDFSQADYAVETAIDGKTNDSNNGWAIAPQTGQQHVAIFETAEEYAATGAGLLRLQLVHNFSSGKHNLGRFRVSITRSPRPIAFGLPDEITDILAIESGERTAEQQTQLLDYYLPKQRQYVELQAKVTEAEKALAPDAGQQQREQRVAELGRPLPIDTKLTRLRRAVELSQKQLAEKRLTAAQDVAWALINSPEFLYNH